jgi:hypothetical protein
MVERRVGSRRLPAGDRVVADVGQSHAHPGYATPAAGDRQTDG